MNTYTVNLGYKSIKIDTSFKIKKKLLERVGKVASHILFDFNHKNNQSSAAMFNESQLGSITKTTKEFFFFLQANKDLTTDILGFNSFESDTSSFLGDSNIVSNLELFPGEHSFIKWKNISLNTSLLRDAFLIDTVTEIIKKSTNKEDTSILIQYGRYYRTISKKIWGIKAKFISNDEEITIPCTNHSVIVSESILEPRERVSSFIADDIFINHKEAHIRVADSMVYTVVLMYLSKKLSMQSEYREFAQTYDLDLFVLSDKDKSFNF